MAVRSVQPLIQAAPRDCRVAAAGGCRMAALSGRRRRGSSVALDAALGITLGRWGHLGRCGTAGGGRSRQGPLSLPMGDIVLIACGPGPGRQAARLAASPMRPMIGNRARKLGASPKSKAEAEHRQRQKEPLRFHATCWINPTAKGMGWFRGGTVEPRLPLTNTGPALEFLQ
jgi:hypothetical protein